MSNIIESQVFSGELYIKASDHHRAVAAAVAAERNRVWTQSDWTDYERDIAAAEREACAKVCEVHGSMAKHSVWMAEECAALIRARGQQ